MATKTITITEEAYDRLASMKNEKDSFSDIINKMTRKKSLVEFAGVLSDDETKLIKGRISKNRMRSNNRMKKIRDIMK